MTNPKRLVLFATSENPDPYLNVICHCTTNNLASNIEIVAIADHSYSTKTSKAERATHILEKILTQLRALSEGKYQPFAAGRSSNTTEALKDLDGRTVYGRVLEALDQGKITATTIPFGELFVQLRQWITGGPVIFDVTALQKNLLVDVVSSSLLLDFYQVYAFELTKPHITHGQDDLFHSLKVGQDFAYRNLLESPPVQKAKRRLNRWRIQAKNFSWLMAGISLASIIAISIGPKEAALYYITLGSTVLSISAALVLFVREKQEP